MAKQTKKLRTYLVKVSYSGSETIEIEAESEEQAIELSGTEWEGRNCSWDDSQIIGFVDDEDEDA